MENSSEKSNPVQKMDWIIPEITVIASDLTEGKTSPFPVENSSSAPS